MNVEKEGKKSLLKSFSDIFFRMGGIKFSFYPENKLESFEDNKIQEINGYWLQGLRTCMI